MKPLSKKRAKKPYQSPKLLIYGNLTQMTNSVGAKGHMDGGTQFGKRRTGR
jgi:hypothetical protein